MSLNRILSSGLYILFLSISTQLLVRRFNYPITEAKNKLTIFALIPIAFGPLYAYLTQKFGGKITFMIGGYSAALAGFILLAWLPSKPSILVDFFILLLGQETSVYVACTMVSLIMVCPEHSLSLIIGLTFFLYNLFIAISSQIVGLITKSDSVQSYQNALYLLIAVASTCLVISLVIYRMDFVNGGFLNMRENCVLVEQWRAEINTKKEEKKGSDEVEEKLIIQSD